MNCIMTFFLHISHNIFTCIDSPKQLAYLEKLLSGDFFVASARVTGEYALTATLDLLVALEPTILDATPKLKKFYTTMIALPAFSPYKDWPMYFNRT